MIRAASDVGGTFTYLVYIHVDDATGAIRDVASAKAHTTPPNFEQGVLDSFRKADIALSDVAAFAHGTTVVINALTERKGAKTGLITTQGFRDILEIGRGNRPDFYNLRYRKPEPFVPRYRRREIAERMTYQGEVLTPVDLDALAAVIEDFKADGVEAVAIAFLHAYANPAHEVAAAETVKRLWPDVSVVASHEISREWREYERTNTAAVCAYVQPLTDAYLTDMETRFSDDGFAGPFYVMQSNGGVYTIARTKRTPISIVESGPASGVLGAAALGRFLGLEDVIAFDIGGTTAKYSLIDKGEVSVTSRYMIEQDARSAGYPIMTPVVDIVEIGNGGGSIGWVDKHRKLHVGPQSAGAAPGPVAYGQGGTEPTTTDANLLLRRINPDYFIGGEVAADMSAVEAAFERLGAPLGLSAVEAARGVVRIANNNMINALKLVSINRGYDPRDFTLVAFGGGGAMHAAALASALHIPRVVIPAHSAVFSAWGMLMSDLRRDFVRTKPGVVDASSAATVHATFAEMEAEAIASYRAEQIDPARVRVQRYADMRYAGQEHAVRVPVDAAGAQAETLVEAFKALYEKEYTYRLESPVEIVSYYVVAYAAIERAEPAPLDLEGFADGARKGRRTVDFDEAGLHDTDIYDRAGLGRGARFTGPAVIEEPGATTVVPPGRAVAVDDYGNIHITNA
ncbi:MAG: hydantoinase/oxoprolinase family protein [Pseudomonadota bacterium]